MLIWQTKLNKMKKGANKKKASCACLGNQNTREAS